VFGIKNHFALESAQKTDTVSDHPQILVPAGFQNSFDVQGRALADQRHDRRARGHQGADVGIRIAANRRASRASESSDPGLVQRSLPMRTKNSASLGLDPGQPPSM
jgi:hypothetical protein